MKRLKIRDIPWTALDVTARPYFLGDGVLSAAEGFVPSSRGGYRRTPAWTAWSSTPAGEEIIGMSPVGHITDGAAPQITIATKKPSANALFQYKVLSNATWTYFGMLFGSAQDYTRDRIVYHRMGQREYTLGWDPDAYSYHCHLFESNYTPVGAEPMNQSGITLTPSDSGGAMGAGWARVYLAFVADFSGTIRYGAPDISHSKTVQLTGTSNTNKITVSGIPTGAWPSTTHVFIYRTRVVNDSAQLEFEPAYFAGAVTSGTGSYDLTISDAVITTRPEMESGKFNFPTVGETGKYLANLGLGEHAGRLVCWGLKYAYRLWISGYTDVDGNPVIDNNWWGYMVDLPGRDTIVSVVSFRGKCFALGENGLYRLRDESSDPSFWFWECIALLRGESVRALAVVGDEVFVCGKSVGGEWNIYAADGYNLRPVGSALRAVANADTGVLPLDGSVFLTGANSERYFLGDTGAWGRMNAPAGVKWSVGKDAAFASGAPLLAASDAIYKEGTAYSADESDYVVTREFMANPEERTEWEKVFVFASAVSESVTLNVYGSTDAAAWTLMGTVALSATTGGMAEVPVPAACRQGRRFRVKIAASNAAEAIVEGVSVQARPVPEMV